MNIRTYNWIERYKSGENNTESSLYYRPAGNQRDAKKNLNPLSHVLECDELQDRPTIELKESISSAFNDESMEKL